MSAEREQIAENREATESELTIIAYEKVQDQLKELRENYKRAVDDALAIRNENPARADLLALISESIDLEMVKKMNEKTELEKKIMKAGDQPSRYFKH